MDRYGLAAIASIGLMFYGVRRPRSFIACAAVPVVAFGALAVPSATDERLAAWLVMGLGLVGWAIGLWFVRLMLDRSVSLRLLARVDGARDGAFDDDIKRRVDDLRRYRLVDRGGGPLVLTRRGRAAAAVLSFIDRACRLEA